MYPVPSHTRVLDQLDLGEALHQIGLVGRGTVAYHGGKRVHGRAWEKITNPSDTYFPYNLNIRQKYSENVFREALEKFDGSLFSNVKLKGITIDDKAGDYKVTADLEEASGNVYQVRCKYIIGADGGHSTVRALANIPFIGDHVEEKKVLHWIRMDALVKTNMPKERIGLLAVESPRHGNVLWIAEDHGRTRIGFAIPPEVFEKYGEHISEEAVKEEAIQALKPFELEFVTVDWWTLYSIGQRVAQSFRKDRFLLAGDAGHTHSSAYQIRNLIGSLFNGY